MRNFDGFWYDENSCNARLLFFVPKTIALKARSFDRSKSSMNVLCPIFRSKLADFDLRRELSEFVNLKKLVIVMDVLFFRETPNCRPYSRWKMKLPYKNAPSTFRISSPPKIYREILTNVGMTKKIMKKRLFHFYAKIKACYTFMLLAEAHF
jgi:hypothetical protein